MKLQHLAAASPLVQAVDVLGHNCRQMPCLLQRRQKAVGAVGLHIQTAENFLPVKIIEGLRIPVKKTTAQDLFRRIGILLVVKSIGTSEIRNTAFGRNASTSKKDGPAAFLKPAPEQIQLLLSSREIGQ